MSNKSDIRVSLFLLGAIFLVTQGTLAFSQSLTITSAQASNEALPAANAIDKNNSTFWSSGELAPQWIQIRLNGLSTVGLLNLNVNQSTPGQSTHEISAGSGNSLTYIKSITVNKNSGDLIPVVFDPPLKNIDTIRIQTVAGPAVVSWNEIDALVSPSNLIELPEKPLHPRSQINGNIATLTWAPPVGAIRGITFYQDFTGRDDTRSALALDLPYIKDAGFNAVWLVSWVHIFSPQFDPVQTFNPEAFEKLRSVLELLRQNNLKAILPLNYVSFHPYAPVGLDECTWLKTPSIYARWEAYVSRYLSEIEDYSDMVYIMLFSENAIPCDMGTANSAEVSSLLQQTLGSLPLRLPANLRNKFTIGYHDHTFRWNNLPAVPVNSGAYDFMSTPEYAYWNAQNRTDQEIRSTAKQLMLAIKTLYGHLPVMLGEFGVAHCNIGEAEQGARITSIIDTAAKNNFGYSNWGWRDHLPGSACGVAPYEGFDIITRTYSARSAYNAFKQIQTAAPSAYNYKLYRGDSSGSEIFIRDLGNSFSTTEEVPNDKKVYFKISAENFIGEGPFSETVEVSGPLSPTITPTQTFTPTSTAASTATNEPVNTLVPTGVPTGISTPAATPTPVGTRSSQAPKITVKVKNNSLQFVLEERPAKYRRNHYLYLVRADNNAIYKITRVTFRKRKLKYTFHNVPDGSYWAFTVTKSSIRPKVISSRMRLVVVG